MARVEYYNLKGFILKVIFVPREEIAPKFGIAVGQIGEKGSCYVVIRDDLSPRIKRFLIWHEFYHLIDIWEWWGALGREIRANFVAALHEPIGFLATVVASLNRERVRFYIHRIRNGY